MESGSQALESAARWRPALPSRWHPPGSGPLAPRASVPLAPPGQRSAGAPRFHHIGRSSNTDPLRVSCHGGLTAFPATRTAFPATRPGRAVICDARVVAVMRGTGQAAPGPDSAKHLCFA